MGKVKPFIRKDKAVRFELVHRSQRDPLAADENAPQRVLKYVGGGSFNEDGSAAPGSAAAEFAHKPSEEERDPVFGARSKRERLALLGIDFDDADVYDYEQHLKEMGQPGAYYIGFDEKKDGDQDAEQEEESGIDEAELDDEQRLLRKLAKQRPPGPSAPEKFGLPSDLFATEEEEDVGLLNRAAPIYGPKTDWDPDIVAALDEAYDLNDPEWAIEDDFIMQAVASGDENEEGEGVYDNDDDVDSTGAMFSDADDDDKAYTYRTDRSRFTEYSMTSSVMPRSEKLQQLDDQFEEFFAEYEDEEIGDLDAQVGAPDAIGNVDIQDRIATIMQEIDDLKLENASALRDVVDSTPADIRRDVLLRIKAKREAKLRAKGIDPKGKNNAEALDAESSDDEDDVEFVLGEQSTHKKPDFDVETILSTTTNLYNRPKLIDNAGPNDNLKSRKKNQQKQQEDAGKSLIGVAVDVPKVELSGSHGIPKGVIGAAKRTGLAPDVGNSSPASGGEFVVDEESELIELPVKGVARPKKETPEEKRARKKLVKEERQLRRATKKETKQMFKEEEGRLKDQAQLNRNANIKALNLGTIQ
eukprot:Clim_evm15s169 gene=Clim_evmTU15s169